MAHFKQALPLPMDPSFMCKGVEIAKCAVFKSTVQPMRITFNGYHVDDPQQKTYMTGIMFKLGDDLR